jgi:hypothetical protein
LIVAVPIAITVEVLILITVELVVTAARVLRSQTLQQWLNTWPATRTTSDLATRRTTVNLVDSLGDLSYNRHIATKELKMIKLKELREGSVVYVRGAFGTGPSQKATVTAVEEDIKNGRPGIDYTTEDGDDHWAYLDQVQAVYKF